MIINGKAKEDFLKWFDNDYMELACEYDGVFNMPITSLNALIIEFFDNMEYKGIRMYSDFFSYFWKRKIESQSFNDICKQTIDRCNEFYNDLNLNQLPNYESKKV